MAARILPDMMAAARTHWRKDRRIQALIRRQTAINTALNAIMPTFLLWILSVPPPVRVTGLGGLLQSLVVGVLIGTSITFVSTIRTARRGLRDGTVPQLQRQDLHSVVRLMPSADAGAFLAILALSLLLVVPAGVAVAVLARRLPLDSPEFAVANALVGIVVGLWVAPRVVLHALSAQSDR